MPRGGKRTPKVDPATGELKRLGRPKAERLTDNKVATRVLAQAKVEQLWLEIIKVESAKMRDPLHGSSTSLRETLKYLENRSLGNCVDTVNHLHDKPLEVNATLTLGEGMRIAMEKAEERVRSRQ